MQLRDYILQRISQELPTSRRRGEVFGSRDVAVGTAFVLDWRTVLLSGDETTCVRAGHYRHIYYGLYYGGGRLGVAVAVEEL